VEKIKNILSAVIGIPLGCAAAWFVGHILGRW
jgi:hypothetical protein